MTRPDWIIPAALGVGAAVLITWNLGLGVRLSSLSSTSRTLRVLSGLGAFLFVPALVIGVFAPSAPGARVLGPLAWLWPVVTLVFLVQGLLAAKHGRASALAAIPLVLLNLIAAWVACARWVESVGGGLPEWALVPGMAVSTFAAWALGAAAFPWGVATLMPVLVPAAPARQRITRIGRVLVATSAAAAIAVTVLAMPRAYDSLQAARSLEAGPPEANARGDLAIGIALFGVLAGSPSATSARQDVSLADSLGVTALLVTLTPAGTTALALDSVARSIESRRDSVALVVMLKVGSGAANASVGPARLAMIERVVRRLRPQVLLPADRIVYGADAPSVQAWQTYYETIAEVAQRVNRRVVIALVTDASTSADSALVDWVMQGGSRVGAVALSVRDGGAEPARFVDALHAMARWASMAREVPDVWIVGVPSAPTITGEVVQQRLVRHALLWAAARPWVRGVIAGDASDITTPVGLRTASGRARRALVEVATALRARRDAPTAPDPAVAADSTAGIPRVPPPDTLVPPTQ